MAEKSRGVFATLFVWVWNLFNFIRRLVFGAIALLLLIIFLVALRSSGGTRLGERTALVLDPKGNIVEQYTSEPAQRALASAFGGKVREVQLRDILRAIDAAAADSRIERLVIEPDEIASAGMSTLHEIGAAIERFKAAGKDVVAVSNSMSQGQYLLAAHANQILLHPEGDLLLEGLGRYRTYYKDALDWLGVDVHLFRVGEYKSYAEPYIRNDASPESREADLFWMNDVWNDYLKEVGAARKLDPKVISAQIDNYATSIKAANGDLAKLALDDKLVDKLATHDEAEAMLIAKGVKEEHSFRQVDFQDYLSIVQHENLRDTRPQVAVVVAEGEIMGGDQAAGTVGGESTAKLIRRARENNKVKALVLRVNSPGGDAFASELIRREIELTKAAGKPVIVSMGDVAASGGYWISMNGDQIFAEPNTITGSIGIFGLFMNIPNTLAKIGVHTDGVGTTAFAGAIDPRRALDPKVGAVIQSIIDKGYQNFIGKVAAARNKTPQQIDAIARGRVWSGAQAKERGLVDQLGGLREATAAAAQAANIAGNYQVRYVEKEMSAWERFAVSLSNDALTRIGRAVVPEAARVLLAQSDVQDQLKLLRSLDANKVGVFAYCFCEIK
ncbi:MAG TPA: signal peptide peptidase SppA [Rudaea sp.]|jgi:protease-4|uniref:signal peptide peptidase SppA n=1 Tax=Rudaea sp. TaxID=2136325 RepID=UPI002F9427C5